MHDDTKEYHAYITADLATEFSAHIDRSHTDYFWLIENPNTEERLASGYAPTKDEAQIAVYEKAKELKLI